MQSTASSSSAGCGTCKLCKPIQQYQTLMPQNFMKVVESNINHRPKSFFVVTDGLIFGDLTSIPFDPLVDPGPYVCFNCWHSGHSHVECKLQELRRFCQNCGRKGVTMNDCPRCALAYLEFGMHNMELCCRGSDDDYGEVKQDSSPELQVYLNHFSDVEPIPFDIEVDVPHDKCINCLGPRHSKSQLCDNARSGYYCFNCGRSDVQVYNCPRCCYAHSNYVKRRDKAFERDTAKPKVTNHLAICGADDKPSKPAVPQTQPAKQRQKRTPVTGPFGLYFKALRDIVVQSMDDTKSSNTSPKQQVNDTEISKPPIKQRAEIIDLTDSINGTKSTVSSGIGEEYLSDEDDEDLDQIIVDEDEKPQLHRPPSEGVREFLNLMDVVKHLPIDVQSSVALQFVRKRRMLMNEKKESFVDRR